MRQPTWREHLLPTPELSLAWYEAGAGPTVVVLHGGPGDDHHYLRALAAPLTPRFRCVLYDQRGSGGSHLARLDASTLHVERFCADLEALRAHLGEERLTLVGHSWGAQLALLYGTRYPERVARLALVGLGPLTDELSAVARANRLRPLSAMEREAFAALAARRRAAFAAADWVAERELHLRLVTEFYVRSWFYSPAAAARFAAEYRATYAHNPTINRVVSRTVDRAQVWAGLSRVSAPVLIVYGYQDFEPITQAYLLRERLPQARVRLLNECGHLPWLEQPEPFYAELEAFLRGDVAGRRGQVS